MQISSVGSLPSHPATGQVARPEAAERGPDRDHDGDEASRAAASSKPAPTGGRGIALDIVA